jgi:putative DNA primase/helicase
MMTPDLHEIERQVTTFMESHGITPPRDGLILDGKIHRYPVEADKRGAKSGAYQIHVDGWPAGWVQDFHLGEPLKWKFQADDAQRREWRKYPPSNAQRRERAAEAETQRQEENVAKLETAWAAYSAARPIDEADEHPYLLAKRVSPKGGFPFGGQWCGLRVDSSGNLLIPMQNPETGELAAIHRVFARPNADGKFSKGWMTAAAGGYLIGSDVRSGPVLCAEGIATALSVYQAYTESKDGAVTVLACMDCNNLAKQAPAIRKRWPDRRLIVIVDGDEAGRKAKDTCLSAGFDGVWEVGDSNGR